MSPVKRNKKITREIVEHKLEGAFSDGVQDVQLEHFILLSDPISQQVPRLTSLYFFSHLTIET